MQKKPSAVVIGAGLSGMTAALLLTMHGYQVAIIESDKKVGQMLRGFYKSRVYFDSGMHFAGELSEHGLLTAYLSYLGLRKLECVDFDPACFEKVRFSDGCEFDIAVGYEAMLAQLINDFPAEKQGIQRYMSTLREAYYLSPFHSLRKGAQPGIERNYPQWQVPASHIIAQHVSDPYLRTLLAIPSLYHGVEPDNTLFIQHAWVAGTHMDSVRTFARGGLALAEAFEERLKEAGVAVHCEHRAVKVHCQVDGRLQDVELDNGERLSCDVAVYTGHPHYLPALMPEHAMRPAARSRLRELHDSMSGHLLYLTSDRTPPDILNKKNVLYCRHDLPFNQQFVPQKSGNGGPFYVMSGPSVLAQQPGETNAVGDYIAVAPCLSEEYLPFYGSGNRKRPAEYRQLKKDRLKTFSDQLFAALPEISGLRVVGGGTPLTLQKYLHSPHCGMYGVAHNINQYPPLPNTKVPGFYLAGQGITAPGVLGAIISAFVACGFVVGHSTLIDGVRACK